MDPQPANSDSGRQLTTVHLSRTAAAAWRVICVLLSRGRPVRPSELATILDSGPEIVRFLCSFPDLDSPIRIADNHFNRFSFATVAQLCARSDVITRYLGLGLPRIVPRLLSNVRSNDVVRTCCRKRKESGLEIEDFPLTKRKARFIDFSEELEENLNQLAVVIPGGFQNGIETLPSSSSILEYDIRKQENIIFGPAMLKKLSFDHVSYEIENVKCDYNDMDVKCLNSNNWGYLHPLNCISCSSFQCRFPHIHNIETEEIINSFPFPQLSLPPHIMGNTEGSKICDVDILKPIISSMLEIDEQIVVPHEENEDVIQGCATLIEYDNGKMKEVCPHESCSYTGQKKNQPMTITFTDKTEVDRPEKTLGDADIEKTLGDANIEKTLGDADIEKTLGDANIEKTLGDANIEKTLGDANIEKTFTDKTAVDRLEKTLGDANIEVLSPARDRNECHLKSRDDKLNVMKNSSLPKPAHKDKTSDMKIDIGHINNHKRKSSTEKRKRASSKTNDHIEKKSFPDFESFTVEEEEGSGGYGTVYRARRKVDGVTVAIKCPHVNANRNYVINEMKMLERLRGKHYVIRSEGSFKSGSGDCLVLEHIEHDRPETLKKEIDITHLQWYGYCLFKALAGLHNQGIVHRDVKPGNFLYSRKASKGFLIDFNLALDMHKKCGTFDNSKTGHSLNDPVHDPRASSLPPAKSRKLMNKRLPEAIKGDQGKVAKSILPPGNLKKKVDKAKVLTDASGRSSIKSQGGDGSGITSAKDATSNKTQSTEKFRQPIPSQGRKELLSLVQENLQGENRESVTAPLSKRKRVAASPGDAENFFLYPTPMPLQANGMSVRGAGLLKSKGDGKPKKDGPCVGTKGFKAPEVLFRSLHQGPKADVWSAGVTLLYMMIGKSPFAGDLDQNLKEIAKLRGSEDLWEVAKLHNHESLFPKDLLDVKYLSPMKLGEWCERNTRRPDLLEAIPRSLFDLVDRCLTVNPRYRVSAEEALCHEFFKPSRDAIRKAKSAKARDVN